MRDILVVEDHPLVAEATRSLLATMAVDRVEICDSAETAVARLDDGTDWFRIFLDVGIPGANGLSLIHHVHRQGFASRSAVITASENQQWRSEVKRLGFLGYVVKTASADDFSCALEGILAGRFQFALKQCEKQAIHLTRKQTEILAMLRDGISTDDMARLMKVSAGTLNNHTRALLHALRADDVAQAVVTGIRVGYIASAPTR